MAESILLARIFLNLGHVEMFVLMAQRKENIRVQVTAIRALRDAVHLIDDTFRQNLKTAACLCAFSKPHTPW